MDNIDKLTLELLINKNQYRKYLSKTDPTKSKEYEDYLEQRQQYKDAILGLTEQLLDDPTLQINTELNEIFETYIKCAVKYFEIKEIEDKPYGNDETNELFGERAFSHSNMYQKPKIHENTILENMLLDEEEEPQYRPPTHSFWGKAIHKKN